MTDRSNTAFEFPDSRWRQKLRTSILRWYDKHAWIWRHNLHPYRS